MRIIALHASRWRCASHAAVGLLAGVGLAVGIRGLLTVIGIEVPTTAATIEPRTVIAALLVGIVVTTHRLRWP